MSNVDLSFEECFVAIDRLDIDIGSQSILSDTTSISSFVPERREFVIPNSESQKHTMSSRSVRKRAATGNEDYVPGPASKRQSLNRVIKQVGYNFETDKLEFAPLDRDRYSFLCQIVPPTYSESPTDFLFFQFNKVKSKKINIQNCCVLLRCAYFIKHDIKPDPPYNDVFDNEMEIKVNGVNFPFISPTEDDPLAPLDGPADISRYCVADGQSTECVQIVFDTPKPHFFSVVLAFRVKDELPIVTMRYSEPRQTFKLVRRELESYLRKNQSNFRKRYTLKDPNSKGRIQIPCRGIYCTHVECFDKEQFLRKNRRRLNWECPVCFKPIKDDQLMIDGLFVEVLAKTFTTCEEVELHSDGSFAPIYRGKAFRPRVIDLDNDIELSDEEEEFEQEGDALGAASPVPIDESEDNVQNGIHVAGDVDVEPIVDLTEGSVADQSDSARNGGVRDMSHIPEIQEPDDLAHEMSHEPLVEQLPVPQEEVRSPQDYEAREHEIRSHDSSIDISMSYEHYRPE